MTDHEPNGANRAVWWRRLMPFLPLAGAVVTCIVILLPFSRQPVQAFMDICLYPLASRAGLSATLIRVTPIAACALGTIVAWKSGLYYLGFDGCYLAGALATTLMALFCPMPAWAFLPLSLLAAFALAGLWALPVGWLRARFGGSEVLTSLMLNYVAVLIVQYAVTGPIRAGQDLPETRLFPVTTWLPRLPGLHAHWGIAVVAACAVAVAVVLYRLNAGYFMRMAGLNMRAARYAGMNVGAIMVTVCAVAGGLAGMGGWADTLGLQHRLIDGVGVGIGFHGIVVAILCAMEPLAVLPVAFVYGGLMVGAQAMQRDFQVLAAIINIFESLLVLAVMAMPILKQRYGTGAKDHA